MHLLQRPRGCQPPVHRVPPFFEKYRLLNGRAHAQNDKYLWGGCVQGGRRHAEYAPLEDANVASETMSSTTMESTRKQIKVMDDNVKESASLQCAFITSKEKKDSLNSLNEPNQSNDLTFCPKQPCFIRGCRFLAIF